MRLLKSIGWRRGSREDGIYLCLTATGCRTHSSSWAAWPYIFSAMNKGHGAIQLPCELLTQIINFVHTS